MKIMIAYSSKTGTAHDCARLLSQKLGGAELCNLDESMPSPDLYDAVIIGGPVRVEKIAKSVRR